MNSGIIVVNKEKDMTSRDVVNKLNHILNMKKIGHTGTLDPMATGVLVVCVGSATKVVDLLTHVEKEYIATMKLGIKTDTYDVTGKILETCEVNVTKDDILDAFKHFEKEYEQEVPIYSAVKVNGKKLYEYARSNTPVELPKRLVSIKEIDLINFENDEVTFRVYVSKGTYIRSLINDIGEHLGCYASMSALERTRQGIFTLDNAYRLSDIENDDYAMFGLKNLFRYYPQRVVENEELAKIKNGCIIDREFETKHFVYFDGDTPIAIYEAYSKDVTKAKPYIML